MPSIKRIRGLLNLRLSCRRPARLILLLSLGFAPHGASAEFCDPPQRPFVPENAGAAEDYADIIRRDFELYFRDIQSYLRCLDTERARAFREAREVSEDYRRFLDRSDE